MANAVARGNGPVEVVNASGALISIPLSSITFDDTGRAVGSGQLYADNQALLDPYLARLVRDGLLEPGPQPPPVPILVITAKTAGAIGNDISIGFANLRPDPSDNTRKVFDATLTQVDTYRDLVADNSIKAVLGSSTGTGSRPGLVFVSSGAAPISLPKVGTYAPDGGGEFTIPKSTGAGNAFKLKLRAVDAAATSSVEILSSTEDPAPGRFTLVASWSRTIVGVKVTDLDSAANFGPFITVKGPDGTSPPTTPPPPGSVVLSGGSDQAAAQPASATVTAP
ncbi:MAG TPA: hypothetical protein VHF27_07870 [Acidimicrobiales bacterium]|nr:hypothetical protein [Acidimicrobiales bacterium]